MTCPHCQYESAACRCQGTQGTLLPPLPPWRHDLRQRVDAYRTRRHRAPASSAPPTGDPHPHILPFPAAAAVPAPPSGERREAMLRSTASALPQSVPEIRPEFSSAIPLATPVAGPVIAPPRPRLEPLPLAPPVQIWEPPTPTVSLEVVLVPELSPESALAAPVVRQPPERRAFPRRPRAAANDSAAFLQIPLPIALPPAAEASPLACPVASREHRLRAGAFDLGIVAVAAALFALAAWASLGFPPPDAHSVRHLAPALAAVPGLLAALYLLACFYAGGATVGMRRAGLCVVGFQGPLTAAACRRRAWASLVSLAALGLGYAWIFCDSQHLTWHDYISRTCVAEQSHLDAIALPFEAR